MCEDTAKALPTILVVMACYNGAEYLDEQLASLFAQQGVRVSLLVRDDGSDDGTPEKLEQWRKTYPDQIDIVEDDAGNLGASGSFSQLLTLALRQWDRPGKYAAVALADQDDIWYEEKLQRSLAALAGVSEGKPESFPVLVHSDLRVVDESGQEMSASLMQYQGLDARKRYFAAQLLSNTVTGCTAVCNRALLEMALPVPEDAMMHDWWLSLVASAFGEITYIDQPLIDYRQHGANTLGARLHPKIGWQRISQVLSEDQRQEKAQAQQLFVNSASQAKAFRARFEEKLSSKQKKSLNRTERMPALGRWGQRLMFRWQRWFV